MSYYNYVTGSTSHFSASIAVPAPYSPVTAQSVTEGFRSLADRTKFLSASIDDLHDTIDQDIYNLTIAVLDELVILSSSVQADIQAIPSNNYTWTGTHTWNNPTTRILYFRAAEGTPGGTTREWYMASADSGVNTGAATLVTAGGTIFFEPRLPTGTIITAMSACFVHAGGGFSVGPTIQSWISTHTNGGNTTTNFASSFAGTSTGAGTFVMGAAITAISTSANTSVGISVVGPTGGTPGNCKLHWVSLTVTDATPFGI